MISSLEIKNFKSIKALSLDLPRLAVLVGPNGSGKTNVVRALELFGDILQRGTTDPAREQGWSQLIRRTKKPARGGLTLSVKLPYRPQSMLNVPEELIRPASKADRITLSASLTLDGSIADDEAHIRSEEIIAETVNSKLRIAVDPAGWTVNAGTDPELWKLFAPYFLVNLNLSAFDKQTKTPALAQETLRRNFGADRTKDDGTENTVLRILNRVRFPAAWASYLAESCQVSRFRLDASALRGDSSFREPTSAVLGPNGEGLPAAVDRLRGQGKAPAAAFQRVLRALQRVYPRIEDVRPQRVQPGRLTLLFRERGIEDELGQANISDGVLHALALLVILEGRKDRRAPGILAIEEPENAIHPWSVRAMMERAQALPNRQVLITTHSETVVNAVQDPGSLFIVENDDRKGTLVTPARDKEAALDTILAETGQKLGDVWMDGSLGGVPGA